ncbi:hypothetical protein DDE18_10270 [Nocardioides gansuensis]|uniref:Peptidase MA-like domain-containing protein n=1 Tax=Nocardioides gansuensis TaxID=2138300 RepID=A0A2T8FAJ2_9ACTN|nr:hypothetical protein DDE18_10270 [Nocardioides gansuensis]
MLALVAAVLFVRGDEHEVDSAPPAVRTASPGEASALLEAFEDAVAAGDEEGAAGLAPDGDAEPGELLATVVANAEALHVRGFDLRYVDQVGAVAPDGSWNAAVDVRFAFDGFDSRAVGGEMQVAFAPDDRDGIGIVRLGGGGDYTPVWLAGPVEVVRTARSLVLVDGSRRETREVVQRVRRAIPVVRRVLPQWQPSVVVEVPGTAAELDAALDSPAGTYAGIAAVTTTVDRSNDPGSPVHVFVNPDVTRRLRVDGAQVVMSHELVHVATDAATSPVDLWLLEGFADYVALRDVKLPLSTTAGRAIALVRRDGVPEHLPSDDDFGTSAPDLEASYELAWLACRTLAERAGEDALVAVYAAASDGVPVARAVATHAGLSLAELEDLWRADLRRLAS